MRLEELVATSRAVAAASGRLDKIGHLAALLTRLGRDEIEIVIPYLTGSTRQGRVGVGQSILSSLRGVDAAASATLEIREVDAAFARVAALSGSGSLTSRSEVLRELFRRATTDEQDFLLRLLYGELRQGALEGVLVDAVGRAADIPAAHVRRAAMLAGALAPVAVAALTEGEQALSRFILQPFRPVQPMLADSAACVDDALATLGEASFEFKLDGARIQVHKADDTVKVYSRNLRDVTAAVPEVVAAALA